MVKENPVNSITNDGKSLKEVYTTGCIRKNGISQEIDIVLKTKDFRGLEI